jgi:hypothetical protein
MGTELLAPVRPLAKSGHSWQVPQRESLQAHYQEINRSTKALQNEEAITLTHEENVHRGPESNITTMKLIFHKAIFRKNVSNRCCICL